MKFVKVSLVLVSVLFIVMSVAGCVLSQYVTPAEIDMNAKKYVVDAGVADVNDFKGWHNMIMAAKLRDLVEIAYKVTDQKLDQMKDRNNLQYAIHQKTTVSNYKNAAASEELLFGKTGILSLVMGMTGCGALTGFLGLSRKRPGDITKPEMEQALATATNKTVGELSAKEKQFVQLVKGIQNFMGNGTDPLIVEALKNELKLTQDADTRTAVAVAKVV